MARLVHGSTDLLQPINLLPNSDFSRSGGYSETITITKKGTYFVCHGITLELRTPDVADITVTRNNSGLKIDITSESTFRLYLRSNVGGNLAMPSDGLYSVCWDVDMHTIPSGSILYNYTGTDSSCRFYYQGDVKMDKPGYYKAVNIISGSSSSNWHCYPHLQSTTGGTYSFTIHNYMLYKGAYTNPPVVKSLDVLQTNQFALTQDIMSKYSKNCMTTINTKLGASWIRLYKIRPDSGIYGRTRHSVHILQDTSYGHSNQIDVSFNSKKFYALYSVSSNNSAINLTKIRVAYYENKGTFFEVYQSSYAGTNIHAFVNSIIPWENTVLPQTDLGYHTDSPTNVLIPETNISLS